MGTRRDIGIKKLFLNKLGNRYLMESTRTFAFEIFLTLIFGPEYTKYSQNNY